MIPGSNSNAPKGQTPAEPVPAGGSRSPHDFTFAALDAFLANFSNTRMAVPAVCILLAVMVCAVFGQTLGHGFVNYDDNAYVYDNPAVTGGLTLRGVAWAFTHDVGGNWHPLTTISHMVDCQIYGVQRPWGHHLANVLLHAAAAILLFLVLRRMTGALWRSAFVAAVFAIHPLRVESVAWVAERKDVLSGVFFMLTLGAYARHARRPASRARYFAVIALFALGLMCKPTLVTLPFVLLLLDYWPLRRCAELSPKLLIVEKIPLFILSACSCVATLLAQQSAFGMVGKLVFSDRAGNAVVSYMVYLRQMICPVELAALYPYPTNPLPVWEVLLAALALASITAGVFAWRRKYSFLLVGWLWYLGMLVPMIGLLQVGLQAHADRYTYLPQIGLYIAVAWMAADLCTRLPHRRIILGAVAVVALAGLMWCAAVQASYWRDSESLWLRTVACTRDNATAEKCLGGAYLDNGQVDEAISSYRKALYINPDYADAHYELGNALLQKGAIKDATAQYDRTLEIDPNDASAHYNLGGILLKSGSTAEAIFHLQKAVEINPAFAAAEYNLGAALHKNGQVDEAVKHYQKALEIDPDNFPAHYELGVILLQAGNAKEAVSHFQKAVKIKPDFAEAHYYLGLALSGENQIDKAIIHYQKAIELQPNFAGAIDSLGFAFFRKGRLEEAIAFYRKALNIDPDNPHILTNLAYALATSPQESMRDGGQAVALAQQANRATKGSNPVVLEALAAAYAETEHYGLASEIAKRALVLANSQSNAALANLLQSQLMHYQAKTPFRDSGSGQ